MPSISKMVQWVHDVCNDPTVGYWADSTTQRRWGYLREFDGIHYFDCSSLVNFALIEGGWETPRYAPTYEPFNTYTEPEELERLGWVNLGSNPDTVSIGDIGHYYKGETINGNVKDSGHTEICYQAGKANTALWMGAHGRTGSYASDFAAQVSEGDSPKTWRRIYHYYGEDTETGTTGDIPVYDISMEVVAGIAGNWWWESSGINPARWGIGSTDHSWTALNVGYGLGQWTNVLGDIYGSLYQLANYLKSMGYGYTSGDGQVEFFLYQDSWNTYNDWQKFDGFSSLSDYLHTDVTDIDQLTKIFCYCWEGVSEYNIGSDVHLEERQEYAHRAYNYIIEHYDDESIIAWYAKDDYLSDEQALNNAVLLYRILMNHANNLGYSSSGNNNGGDNGWNVNYPEEQYKYVDPVTLSYDDLMALAFGKLSNEEKAAIISIHKPPKGM